MKLRPFLPDLVMLGLVLAAAVAVRLLFLSADPPVFLTTDSLTYALPASHLAHGQGFDLSLRRTPGYPAFLAGIWSVFGDDLRPVAVVQHVLGIATAGLTWLLGRSLLGRVAGLLGGLVVALSAPQLVYEHYLMTETLFTFVLVLGVAALAFALRRGIALLFVATGVLFALSAMIRPVGQIFPLLVPLAAFFAPDPPNHREGTRRSPTVLRPILRPTLLVALGFALILVPWMLRNLVVGGELTGSSALGKTLFGRITRHDDGFRFDLPPAGSPERDPRRAEARAFARREAQRDTSRGSLVHDALMQQYGYTEAQAYNVMRDVALEVILAQPAYYLQSSLAGVGELFLSEPEPFRSHVERLSNDRLRRDWRQAPEVAGMLPAPVPPEERWKRLGPANDALQLFRPLDDWLGPLAGVFFVVGVAAVAMRPGWRAALPVPLIALIVLVLSAFLDGPVARFRYPLDPLIAITAGAGLVAAFELPRRVATWRRTVVPTRVGRATSVVGAEGAKSS